MPRTDAQLLALGLLDEWEREGRRTLKVSAATVTVSCPECNGCGYIAILTPIRICGFRLVRCPSCSTPTTEGNDDG